MKYNKIIDFKIKPKPRLKPKLKSRLTSKQRTKKIKSTYDGGAAFVKGGFGCVFKPALSCKNSDIVARPNYVSKLIEKTNGKREYMYIYNIKKKLESLPANVKKYFLLDNITICEPKALTDKDKVKIEDVCDYILSNVNDRNTNAPVTSDNINNNLHKFKIINMPELSMTLHDYILKTVLSPANFVTINNIIIEYLTVVIPAMYKNNVVHSDIKSENMMINMYDNNRIVLIDWGLSYIVDNDRKSLPKALNELSVQFIHPFSGFLFKYNLVEKYDTFLKNLKKEGVKITRDSLRVFAISEYMNFMAMNNKQFSFFNHMFTIFYNEEFAKYLSNGQESYSEDIISYNMTMYYIVEYIVDILIAYTVDYNFELVKYFNEVYLMNVDSWGLMSIYIDLIKSKRELFKMTAIEHKIFVNKMMYILTEYFFKNGNLPINIPKIVSDIKNLNGYLMSMSGKRSSVAMVNKLGVRGVRHVSKSRRSRMQPADGVVNGGYKTKKCTNRGK